LEGMEAFDRSGHPKYAYLVGNGPKSNTVHLLVKVHDWDVKAVYIYDLVTPPPEPKHISGADQPELLAKWMTRAKRDGHQIPHKGRISVKKVQAWVQYAKAVAAKRRLTVAK